MGAELKIRSSYHETDSITILPPVDNSVVVIVRSGLVTADIRLTPEEIQRIVDHITVKPLNTSKKERYNELKEKMSETLLRILLRESDGIKSGKLTSETVVHQLTHIGIGINMGMGTNYDHVVISSIARNLVYDF